MGWLASFTVAFLTAGAGCFAAGSIAILAVDWYNIPGREGESGYFVVLIALLGLVAGGAIGLIAARVVAAGAHPGFFRALGLALGIVAAIGGVSLGLSRLLADVPPTIDGEALFFRVEVRWPAGSPSPAQLGGEGILTLGSVTPMGHVQRKSETGPLWLADARQEEGRWIVPGVVEIFTERGDRVIDFAVDTTTLAGFVVPLPRRPKKADLAWSGWLPTPRPPNPPWPADRFSYRYRVQLRSEPVRTDLVGPFEIATIADWFSRTDRDHGSTWTAQATFGIKHQGQPVVVGSAGGTLGGVAVIGGSEPALIVNQRDPGGNSSCYLVTGGDPITVTPIGGCSGAAAAFPLTDDAGKFRAARNRTTLQGRIDQVTYAEPGRYWMGSALLDTKALAVRPFTSDPKVTPIPAVPPIGLSPDGRSLVRFTFAEGHDSDPVVAVRDIVAESTAILPVDPLRMRFSKLEDIDPAWLAHHFVWRRGADGIDRLTERPGFVPLPYHGTLTIEGPDYRTYRIESAGRALREALVEFLVTELGGERMAADSTDYEIPVRVRGQLLQVAASSQFDYVAVSPERGVEDLSLLREIAERFDRALATGKYDPLFGKPRL
jgi:hypothetical protein